MNGDTTTISEPDNSEYVEVDPTGRYGRYNEVLGKGASKTVYRAFDEYDGIEVAWNQVKLCDFLQTPEDLERLYREIHLLKTLKHNNIMKFYSSWVDTANRNINFVTEMFTSGTLRQYRLKHKKVNIRAVKQWCRQILRGLHYLHSHDPPVIHRDLKCDNIFVNGNQGEVKIGDLGLAAILRKSYVARCVGTPEFMAPEIYEEEYNELVDIYSFGMCILEMVTFEYPYSECSHPAQIYKKVVSGKKPDSLYKVKDLEVRYFVEKCLATVSTRLSARELLNDPFLQIDGCDSLLRPIDYYSEYDEVNNSFIRGPLYGMPHGTLANGYVNYYGHEAGNVLDYCLIDNEVSEIDLFSCQEDEHLADVDITIKGRRRGDDDIFLRLRIADKEGRIRNIYFPFDLENDNALSVANEMVSELDITDQDVKKIADMIDGEIATLVPEWKRRASSEETPDCTDSNVCHNCAVNSSLLDYVSPHNPATKNLHILQCSEEHGCASIHGRFEEITYQVEGSEQFNGDENLRRTTSENSSDIRYADIWAQRDGPEAGEDSCNESHGTLEQPKLEKEGTIVNMVIHQREFQSRISSSSNPSVSIVDVDDHENEIRQELRWLKAKYQMQLRELRDQQLGVKTKCLSLQPNSNLVETDNRGASVSLLSPNFNEARNKDFLTSLSFGKNIITSHYSPHVAYHNILENRSFRDVENVVDESSSPELMVTAKSFYTGSLIPHSLQRATSLPVDAIDF